MRESVLWFWHLVSGVVILVLLALHMVIMHLDAILGFLGIGYADPVSFDSVMVRSKQVFFMVTYVLLLGAALYHGLYGTRTILFELTLKKGLERLISVFFVIAGIGLFIYGTYTAIVAFIKPF